MDSIQSMIERYIEETGDAHTEYRPGEGVGVVFHDESQFILLSDLAYNADLGFFQVSAFPDRPREAEWQAPKCNWSTAMFSSFDGQEDYKMYAVIPDDDTDGFIIGEWQSVLDMHAALGRLIETSTPDEVVTELDERLGHKWLSVSQAADEFSVPVDTVRYAAREGHIPLAKKQGRDWRFPQRKFLWWLVEVYRPKTN